jgi:hypothetical protein
MGKDSIQYSVFSVRKPSVRSQWSVVKGGRSSFDVSLFSLYA